MISGVFAVIRAIELLLLLFFGVKYMTDDKFRKEVDDRNKVEERKRIKSERESRIYNDSELDEQIVLEIKDNLNIFNNCLKNSFYCSQFKNLEEKLAVEISSKEMVIESLDKLKLENSKTMYGCFCRINANDKMYQNCPLDDLDNICKRKYHCLYDSFFENNYNFGCDDVLIKQLTSLDIHKNYQNVNLEYGFFLRDSRKIYGRIKLKNALHNLLAEYYEN